MNLEMFLWAIRALLEAKDEDEDEASQVLKDHPELLDDEVDFLLAQLISKCKLQGDEQGQEVFDQVRAFLHSIRPSDSKPPSSEWSNLSLILEELSKPAQLKDMPRRIELCRRALEFVPSENKPLWAVLQNGLGNSLVQSLLGDRTDNIEQAIEHYNLALMVGTQEDFSEVWAATQNNLAAAYYDRIMGDRADNIEQAIEHYSLALKVRTQEDFPVDWAATLNNMAVAYNNRILGDRADNIEQAIEHYEMALKVRTQEDFPVDWAATQNNLANAYNDRILGDRADNIEQAIEHYELALKVRTQENFPVDWAATLNNMANACRNRILGDRADNIEQAIEHYELALKVRTQESFPVEWAITQNNLAVAYNNRILGDRADNIELAIKLYNLALKVRTQEDFPVDWAITQNNLANACRNRIQGDRADNIEQAIHHYELALNVYRQKDFPEVWAAIQNNLAVAYNNRIQGDRADNIELAIKHYELALKVRTQENFPVDWAMTQNNLANAYNNRILGDRADNIEQAIEHYELALKVRTQENFPVDWAETQNNMANAYNDRILGDRAGNIEQAIEHYKLALKIRMKEDFPVDWAETQNNMANAYRNRIRGDRADNIEQAIEHYNQALTIYTYKDFPNRCRGTAYRLGNIFLEGQRFSQAGGAYLLGVAADEKLYRAAIFKSSRDAELAETFDLYRRAGYALANSNKLKEAIVAMEQGRARGLGSSLVRDRADLESVQQKDLPAYELYIRAVEVLQSLESQERAGASAGGVELLQRDLMMQARGRLDKAVDRIRHIPGYESFLKVPDFEEIAAAVIEGQPLIYISAISAGGVALIVHRHSASEEAVVEAVLLDKFSEPRLQEILTIWFDTYGGWQQAMENLRQNKIGADDYLQAEGRWFDTIEIITGQLWQEVMGPIFGHLSSLKARQAFLIPTGLLSLLPLHAAWMDEEGGRRRYLHEFLPISYIPSARSLAHVRSVAVVAADRLLAVDEPRPVKGSSLLNSHAEVTAICSYFKGPQRLEHEKATRNAVLQALFGAQVAHFSCHGGADWRDPEKSGLLMANGEMLTVKDLFELHLDGARLATLSACETGVPGTKLPDEVVSLPSAFIRAGFAGAIGSLWTVPDQSTAKLMTCFYQLWRQKRLTPVQALAEA
jgi:CHAT domain-containing protein/tetratricopeptide (TPR) repeat protein